MTIFEDHFSEQAREYAQYRPQYPRELFVFLASIAPGRLLAWDCGTGNGQAARELARHFERAFRGQSQGRWLGGIRAANRAYDHADDGA